MIFRCKACGAVTDEDEVGPSGVECICGGEVIEYDDPEEHEKARAEVAQQPADASCGCVALVLRVHYGLAPASPVAVECGRA